MNDKQINEVYTFILRLQSFYEKHLPSDIYRLASDYIGGEDSYLMLVDKIRMMSNFSQYDRDLREYITYEIPEISHYDDLVSDFMDEYENYQSVCESIVGTDSDMDITNLCADLLESHDRLQPRLDKWLIAIEFLYDDMG